jgi:pyruvate,water dikinase
MTLIIKLEDMHPEQADLVGGKGFALSKLKQHGFLVPRALSITSLAYRQYIHATGLRERIALELHRKNFADMRWEELWDASLRIRNMFLKTPMPEELQSILAEALEDFFGERPVVVRSSAPGEDSASLSFAGLHESYVNIRGKSAMLEHVKKVWASLWSDAALLYRKELGLAVETSVMAVLVQEIVLGERSGVVFGQNPNDSRQAVVESVYGLNQGLVDGTVAPDRWILDRTKKSVISYSPATREKMVVATSRGVAFKVLPSHKAINPPLQETEVLDVLDLALRSEVVFGSPQDVEWTYTGDSLCTLQSRPITTIQENQGYYSRSWYLQLKRSFENLKTLQLRIEKELIPAMISEGEALRDRDLTLLSNEELQAEIFSRQETYAKWKKVYWDEFIPFAHGARLFGQVYNDTVSPTDPYEFIELLGTGDLMSIKRNALLEDLALYVQNDPELMRKLETRQWSQDDSVFSEKIGYFMEEFGELSCHQASCLSDKEAILNLVLEMASSPATARNMRKKDKDILEQAFLNHFEDQARAEAQELLDLARASYRLRDDDNIHLGRIEGQLMTAVQEGLRRIGERVPGNATQSIEADEVIAALQDPSYRPRVQRADAIDKQGEMMVKARQLIGQPAGPGLATGKARVVKSSQDVGTFHSGEILVCDAVDPNMTFVVPLASAIVERRGGMLIHGAIIAREYGLPCVTGVPEAMSLIATGQTVTVDGYLGLVILGGTPDK